MQAVTSAVITEGGRLEQISCQPPLTLRQVYSEDAATCALCLVGTSAGPLAGDELIFDLHLLPGARATLQATGASIAQGDCSGRSSLRTAVTLDEDAELSARPGPLIVAAGGSVDVGIALSLAAGATIEWRELIVLGRSDEASGAVTMRWDVTRAGRPVLRQTVDLADPELVRWPGMLRGGRVLATALVSGPAVVATTIVASPAAVAARLDEHTLLATALGNDGASVSAALDELIDAATSQRGATVGARATRPA